MRTKLIQPALTVFTAFLLSSGCPPDTLTETETKLCEPGPCGPHGTCAVTAEDVELCVCETGWVGATCEDCAPGTYPDGQGGCTSDPVCTQSTCSGHGTCDASSGAPVCTCQPGYAGAACNTCAGGYHDDGQGNCVADVTCTDTTCSGHGTCDASSGAPVCTCDAGWTGAACDACAAGYHDDNRGHCVENIACETGWCSGHGTCDDSTGVPICTCETGFTGNRCQTPVGEWPNEHSQLGINLNFFWAGHDNASVDIFRLSTNFYFPQEPYDFNGPPVTDLNPDGYPLSITGPHGARTHIGAELYPSGEYHFFHEGQGTFEVEGAGEYVRQVAPGHHIIRFAPNDGSSIIDITIIDTNREDPLRNMHLIMPGYEDTWRQDEWNPAFISIIEKFKMLRFMDWMMTNFSTVRGWSETKTMQSPGWGEWGRGGVPVEFMVNLCEKVHADGWFNVPHLADDDYVRQLATRLRDQMDPSLRIYIEYSNEVWNTAFDNYHDVVPLADAAGIEGTEWEKVWRWTALRSTQVFAIFEEVFGAEAMGTRVIRVLPSLTGPDMSTRTMLHYEVGGRSTCTYGDVLAVAPYFKFDQNSADPGMSMAQAMTALEGSIHNPWEGNWDTVGVMYLITETNRAIRESPCPNLQLVNYEAGQHLVEYGGSWAFEDLYVRINRDPGMYGIYTGYLDSLKAEGLGIITLYSSVGGCEGTGCWPHIETLDQDIATAHKYRALMDWIDNNPYTWPDVQ